MDSIVYSAYRQWISAIGLFPSLVENASYSEYLPPNLTRSIGLRWCYINITITILDINHRPVFYLKLSSTLYGFPYLTGNTLRLRYEPNRLMLSIGSCRCYINITTTILDIIHRLAFFFKTQLNSIGFSVPHRKHITSPLRAQEVNATYRFVTTVC
jgi:hypothetical protein